MSILCETPPGVTDTVNELQLEVIKMQHDDPLFKDVLAIRAKTYGISPSEAHVKDDEISDHYCAYIKGEPLIIARATQAQNAKLECEEFYPQSFMDAYRHQVASTTRLCSLNRQQTIKLGALFMQASVFDQVKNGMRMDICNVKKDMIGYYRRLGYLQVADIEFIHPLWNTTSVIMICIPDYSIPGIFKSIIDWIPEHERYTREILSPHVQFIK